MLKHTGNAIHVCNLVVEQLHDWQFCSFLIMFLFMLLC